MVLFRRKKRLDSVDIMRHSVKILIFILFPGCTYVDSKEEDVSANFQDSVNQINEKFPYVLDSTQWPKGMLLGKVEFSKDDRFRRLSPLYCDKEIYLLNEVEIAFDQMAAAAKIDRVDLKVISGARSFNHQKSIWSRKWDTYSGDGISKSISILLYSAMPGTSRHHWGTDLDLNSLNNEYFESGEGLKIYNWLVKNAGKYGFYQPYTSKETGNRKGYEMEKWHWSYAPVSSELLKLYNELIRYSDLTGFDGASHAKDLKIIEDYVNGVANPLEY